MAATRKASALIQAEMRCIDVTKPLWYPSILGSVATGEKLEFAAVEVPRPPQIAAR